MTAACTAENNSENLLLYHDFLDYYKQRVSGSGYITIKYLGKFLITWFENNHINLTGVTIQDAMKYKKSLYEAKNGKNLCTGSIYNRLKIGRKFFKFLIQSGKRTSNPFTELKYPRLPETISRNILTEMQMMKLLEKLSHFDAAETQRGKLENYRMHVIVVLLYATGMRIFEAANLLPADIDVKRREVVIRHGKGGKSRIAYLTGYAADVLDNYLRKGRKVLLARGWRKNGGRLFGLSSESLAQTVNRGLYKICAELDLPHITCHSFRHSLGTHLLKAGCDIRYIQLILGHDKISSTQRYTKVDRDDLQNIIDRYHPRNLVKQESTV
jgi:site-specific recombinase XerD